MAKHSNPRRSGKSFDERLAELEQFIRQYGRDPSRHWPQSPQEESLGWWVKDQRRKMRHASVDSAKRGTLTDEQKARLTGLGIEPMVTGYAQPAGAPQHAAGPRKRGRKPLQRHERVSAGEARVRVWHKYFTSLIRFIEDEGRLPEIDYRASQPEVKIARWLRVQRQRMKARNEGARGMRAATEEQFRLLQEAGVDPAV